MTVLSWVAEWAICGMFGGIGMGLVLIALSWCLHWFGCGDDAVDKLEARAHALRTAQLMAERNSIDREKVDQLVQVGDEIAHIRRLLVNSPGNSLGRYTEPVTEAVRIEESPAA